jgi:ADP-ribose pyrophosphatase YjhB (NUDIX family)
VVRLREYYCDANAPRAHDVLPAAFAAVRNSAGELLLVRRIDDGNWELPGGRIEVGESVSEAVVREVAEESGITILLIGVAGVYSDPSHVLVDPGGSIHQQLALCFHAVPAVPDAGGQPRPDDRGRDRPYGRPPAQIPACAANALGSCLGFWRRSASPGMDASRGQVVATGSRFGSSAPS